MPHRGNNIKNPTMSQCEIANFYKFAKMYTGENIYVHSTKFISDQLFLVEMVTTSDGGCTIQPHPMSGHNVGSFRLF